MSMSLEELEASKGKPPERKSCSNTNTCGFRRPDEHLGAVERDRFDEFEHGYDPWDSDPHRDYFGFRIR